MYISCYSPSLHSLSLSGQSLHRQLGVSRRKGVEVRQRMSAAFTSTDTPEQNGGLLFYRYSVG